MKRFKILLIFFCIALTTSAQEFEAPKDLKETVTELNTDVDNLNNKLEQNKNKIRIYSKGSVDYFNQILQQQQTIINLENHKKTLKKSNEIAEVDNQIFQANNQLTTTQQEFNKISQLEAENQDLNKKLESKTKYLKYLTGYSKTIEVAKRKLAESELQKAQKAIDTEKEAKEDFLKSEILLFTGNVEAWASLSNNYELLALSAKSLLLFNEKTNKKIMKFLKNGLPDLLVLVAGIFAYDNFQSNKTQEGAFYTTGGLAAKLIPSLLKDKNTIETYEAVTRNVAFHDQIIQFKKLGVLLNTKVDLLNQNIQNTKPRIKYRPTENDLLFYREIITTLTEIQFQNLELRNKAEFLLGLAKKNNHKLSNKGEKYLETIINLYDKAINNQNNLTTLFLNRYDLLKSALDNGELSILN